MPLPLLPVTVSLSVFTGMAITASAKTTQTTLTYLTAEGTELGRYDNTAENAGTSVTLTLNDESKSALAAAADPATLTVSYTLAGGTYVLGTGSASDDRYRTAFTIAGKKFYFNATNNNNSNNFPNSIGNYYINFYSNNKITVTYTLTLNEDGNATSIHFSATGTVRTDETINLSTPASVETITVSTDDRSSSFTAKGAALQNLTAVLTAGTDVTFEKSLSDVQTFSTENGYDTDATIGTLTVTPGEAVTGFKMTYENVTKTAATSTTFAADTSVTFAVVVDGVKTDLSADDFTVTELD
ncbi:MAG: hypothetical protein ACI4DP_08175 [Candidatus Ornithomonoglobus sp.]